MEVFKEYLLNIAAEQHRERMEEVLSWVSSDFPGLVPRIAWNQPMFTDHGTFIIGFSAAKHHMAAAPERAAITTFSEKIKEAGYVHSKELIRFPWNIPVDFALLSKIIEFNIMDKADRRNFWRK